MADLTPRTRSESFLNGEDLEPITRREHFYAGRENELPEGHQEPETREEWFIQKYREAGDVTVESLSITENGTYTAPSGKAYSPVSVNVPLPSNAYLLKSIEHESMATFTDGTDNFIKSLEVAIEPQQDLHGYDAPWVGGAGKNKLEVNATSNTVNGVTFTVNSDGTIKANGTATANADLWLHNSYGSTDAFVGVGDYIVNCVGSKSGVQLQIGYAQSVYRIIESESDVSISATNNGISWVLLRVSQGTSVNNTLIKPMIRLATVSDSTFAPYSNECPISGWSAVDVTVADDVDNPTTTKTITIQLGDTYYGGKLDVVNGIITPSPYYASYNGETLTGEWISDRDKYEVGTTPTIGAQVVNIGASDTPVSIAPTIIKSLQGDNNFFASTGEIEILQYWGEVN